MGAPRAKTHVCRTSNKAKHVPNAGQARALCLPQKLVCFALSQARVPHLGKDETFVWHAIVRTPSLTNRAVKWAGPARPGPIGPKHLLALSGPAH
jgi:hypothetical protein